MSFSRALDVVLDLSLDALHEAGMCWTVVGSAASVLQGARLNPGDIDLLMRTPGGVFDLARLMTPLTPDQCPVEPGHHAWHSSLAHPVAADRPDPDAIVWHLARWFVEGFKVEAAHIEPPATYTSTRDPDFGIWECGPEIWPHITTVSYRQHQVPVVPLEIQLHTSMARGLDDRSREIANVLRSRGPNHALLQLALTAEERERIRDLL